MSTGTIDSVRNADQGDSFSASKSQVCDMTQDVDAARVNQPEIINVEEQWGNASTLKRFVGEAFGESNCNVQTYSSMVIVRSGKTATWWQ